MLNGAEAPCFSRLTLRAFLLVRTPQRSLAPNRKIKSGSLSSKNPSVELLQKLGLEHEQRYLRELAEKDGLAIAQIDVSGHWEDAVAETFRALREGVDAVYQATFLEGTSGGRSDFLIRVDKPSALGPWSYEVVETKLARSTKATALVQLCFYSDLLARIQGVEPQWMHVVLGGAASPERFQVQRYIAYFRKVRSEFEQSWKLDTEHLPRTNGALRSVLVVSHLR